MTFTVILEDSSDKELARCSHAGNEKYLMRSGDAYPILSQPDLHSYDVFSHSQATQLHVELLSLLAELHNAEDREHVQELARLALRAANMKGATITFTPFSAPG